MRDDVARLHDQLQGLLRQAENDIPTLDETAVKLTVERLKMRAVAHLVNELRDERAKFLTHVTKLIPIDAPAIEHRYGPPPVNNAQWADEVSALLRSYEQDEVA